MKPENENTEDGIPRFLQSNKSIYGRILKDDGLFASISALQRVKVAEHIFDFGEYVLRQGSSERDSVKPDLLDGNMVYFPPCHQRELNMGMPYLELLRNQYGAQVSAIDGGLYCCGMGGIMGFKKDFHENSQKLGKSLLDAINEIAPDVLVTDCLSCRLQFEQFTPFPVRHPIELL